MTSHDLTSILTQDHLAFHGMVEQLLKTPCCSLRQDLDSAKKQFGNLRKGLEDHMAFEDQSVLPKVRAHSSSGRTQDDITHIHLEHQRFLELLARAQGFLEEGDPHGFQDVLFELQQALAEHNRSEERLLYPALEGTSACSSEEITQETSKKGA